MKKLLAIVASALTLGAFANSAADPVITADTSAVEPGTTCTVMAGSEEAFSFATTGGEVTLELDEAYVGRRVCLAVGGEEITDSTIAQMGAANPKLGALKLAGDPVVCNNTVLEQNFVSETETTTLPEGWTAPFYQGGLTPLFKLGANGALVYNNGNGWKRNALQTACTISSDEVTEIDVVTYADSADRNVVIFLASSDYSVAIGNSYNSNKEISIGSFAGDASDCFVSFQNNTGTNPNDGKTEVVASGAITVGGPLTYHMVLNGTSLTGTVSDGTTTKDISFTLPETYSFSTIGLSLDGPANSCGVKSVTIKNDYVPPREPMTVYATGKAMNAFVDAEGTAVEELVKGDTINLGTKTTGNVWGGGANISNFASYQIVVEGMEMDLGAGSGVPENGKLTINYRDGNKGIYLYGNIGANAKIDGTGLLYLGHTGDACTIGNGTAITCDVAFQNAKKIATINGAVSITGTITMGNGEFKLADGATLTVAEKLADGKVTTDVSKKRVGYNEETKTYSLIQQREMTVRVVENTTRYYLNAKDENGTSTEMIAIEGDSVLIDNGTGFTAYYIANEGYELSKTAGGAKISSDKKMVWYYFTTVTSDQNYDAQVTATAVTPALPGIDLIPEDQKTGYPAWLEANITTETTLEVEDIAAAFLLGATISEGMTIEDAAQAKVKELVAQIDLAALAVEGETAALTTLNAKLADMGLVASLKPVELEGASESTKLYQLVITLKPEN